MGTNLRARLKIAIAQILSIEVSGCLADNQFR